MPIVFADLVQEETTTTGTGTLTLTGATTLHRTFSTGVGNGNRTYYSILDEGNTEWEVGIGTVAAGTLSRDVVIASSNAGSLVNLAAGTKTVSAVAASEAFSGAPIWVKYTISESAFTAAATEEDIELFQLPAGGIIHNIKIKHSTAFSGGTLTAFTISVGVAGELAKYATAFDVFQAAGDTTFQISNSFNSENHAAPTSIRVEAQAVGDNVVNATAGSVDIWVQYSVAV